MKKRMAFLSVVLAIALTLSVAGCGGDKTSAAVTAVELSRATLTLDIGAEATLTYTVLPAGASGAEAKWVSSDPGVATVDGGKVRGVSEGTAAIRVTVGGKSAQCAVTVNDPSKSGVQATGVELSHRVLTLDPGDTETLTATFEPATATNRSLAWATSKPTVATVRDGVVTAVSAGTAVITATTTGKAQGYCVVTVTGTEPSDGGLYVAKVDSLSTRTKPFIMCMDSSELLSLEEARAVNGLTFKDFDGETADILRVLKDSGITDIRIRVWNDPYADAEKTKPYGGGNCDVDNAVALSERCAAVGLGVIVNFHYSDFWADPGKQKAPKAWAGKSQSEVESLLYTFTAESLDRIAATGVTVTMVQIGNETTGGMAGATTEAATFAYMKQGAAAVRATIPTAKIAVHYTNAGNNDYVTRAQKLDAAGVDYDVFGTSWYPYYESHGTLANLTKQLKGVHDKYNKDVMVLETAYAWTHDDFDGCGNTSLESTTQPLTEQGLANAVRDVIEGIADLGDYGLGVAYWGGTWVAASESKDAATNRALCAEYGCGWATQNAKAYDSSANNGGSMVDNNAFFRSDGTPLEALKVFGYVKDGHTTDIRADYIADSEIYYTVGQGTVTLPATVEVVLNNGSRQTVAAYWKAEKSTVDGYIEKVATYDVAGTTLYGGECHCFVWVTNVNLLTEGSFEGIDGHPSENGGVVDVSDIGDWQVSILSPSTTGNLQLYVSKESQNARMGTNSFHWWDSGKVNFKLFQTLAPSALAGSGSYTASFEVQGDQGENVDIHAYITVTYNDGTAAKTFAGDKIGYEGWEHWLRATATAAIADVTKVASVEVGIAVYADPVGEGPWGNIDNCQFYFVE